MGRWDDWAADVRQRKAARRAEWARTGEQKKTEALKRLGKRDDLPVGVLNDGVYLVDSFNEYGVPDLNKVPEASREALEKALKVAGWYYVGASKGRRQMLDEMTRAASEDSTDGDGFEPTR